MGYQIIGYMLPIWASSFISRPWANKLSVRLQLTIYKLQPTSYNLQHLKILSTSTLLQRTSPCLSWATRAIHLHTLWSPRSLLSTSRPRKPQYQRSKLLRRRVTIISSTIAPFINIVRKSVKFFRKSPVKMDFLRSLLKKHPEVTVSSLVLDCKTRWYTMVAMVERYLLLATPITSLVLSKRELEILRGTSATLDAFKWASEQTCSNSLDIASAADVMIRFL